LIRDRLPRVLRESFTAYEVAKFLPQVPGIVETSPGMMGLAGNFGMEPGRATGLLAPSLESGAQIEALLRACVPLDSHEQLLLFKRLAAVRLAASFPNQRAGLTELDTAIAELVPVVTRFTGWDLSEIQALAHTERRVPPAPHLTESQADLRSRLLVSTFAIELLQRPDWPLLDEQYVDLSDKLAQANLRLVAHIARRYANGGFMRYGDLLQEGAIGLMRALERYDPYKGFQFSTYATWWVRQAITRARADLEKLVRLPVHVVDKVHAVKTTARRVFWELHRQPSAAEIALAHKDQITSQEVLRLLQLDHLPVTLTPAMAGQLEEQVEDTALDVFEVTAVLDAAIAELDDRERLVIRSRFALDGGDVLTLQAMADSLGYTREGIRQIEGRALRKLRKAIGSWPEGRGYSAQDEKEPTAAALSKMVAMDGWKVTHGLRPAPPQLTARQRQLVNRERGRLVRQYQLARSSTPGHNTWVR
jgi:RNA polymerase primary sigma factor